MESYYFDMTNYNFEDMFMFLYVLWQLCTLGIVNDRTRVRLEPKLRIDTRAYVRSTTAHRRGEASKEQTAHFRASFIISLQNVTFELEH